MDGATAKKVALLGAAGSTRLGPGVGGASVLSVEEYGGKLYCSGEFTTAGGAPAANLTRRRLAESWGWHRRATSRPASYSGLLYADGSIFQARGFPMST